MRIAIVTDCWHPQINGVTRTLEATAAELRSRHHDVIVISPNDFKTLTLPYQDSLVLPWYPKLARLLREFKPDTVWIATQGPLAIFGRLWCRRSNVHFILSFHTRFPEYAKVRYGFSRRILYQYARLFFSSSAPVLVPSRTLAAEFRQRNILRTIAWPGGVDLEQFRPGRKTAGVRKRPVLVYVGRVTKEKNVDAFLNVKTDGTKVVIGDGPLLPGARKAHPDIVFLGELQGEELVSGIRDADVLVFPSLLDTFGLVVLEALACGVPVATLPAPHLIEIFGEHNVIAFNSALESAIEEALKIPGDRCRAVAETFSWSACTDRLIEIITMDREQRGYGGNSASSSQG